MAQRMTRRIVSLWFPKLGIDRLARRMRHDWDRQPVAVIAETGNRVWHAWTTKKVKDPKNPGKQVDKVVKRLLSSFPPGS